MIGECFFLVCVGPFCRLPTALSKVLRGAFADVFWSESAVPMVDPCGVPLGHSGTGLL